MSGSLRPTPAEQHLGDRLSALVDGELGHESRERVLAHLATCAKCKAEADAQRQLKSVFAKAAPPPPSESFLARLQGLPAGSDPEGGPPPAEGRREGRPGRTSPEAGLFGSLADPFRYVPSGAHASALSPSEGHALSDPGGDHGFRIAHVGRPEERAASRGLRFAFVAAGAVSLAAIALGGVTAGSPTDTASQARGGAGAGSNVSPAQTAATTAATTENRRRRGGGPLLAQGRRAQEDPAVPVGIGAPLLPGAPTAGGAQARDVQTPQNARNAARTLTAPTPAPPQVAAGTVAVSPLIRSLTASPLRLGTWPAPPGWTPPPLPPALP